MTVNVTMKVESRLQFKGDDDEMYIDATLVYVGDVNDTCKNITSPIVMRYKEVDADMFVVGAVLDLRAMP